MKKRQILLTLGALLMIAVLGGCSGSSSNSNTGGGPTQPPQPPQPTSFTGFVHTQIAQTSDTTQPADVNAVTFSFPDDNNPAAFNDVVGSP
ncbi:MAG: hypothetical protein ABIS07_04430 [Dokdonella sp.]